MENTEKNNKKEVTEYEGELEGLLDSINKLKNNDTMPEDKKKEELNNLNSKLEEIRSEIMAKIEEGEYTEEEKKILEDKIKSIEENQKDLANLEASIKGEEEGKKEGGEEGKEEGGEEGKEEGGEEGKEEGGEEGKEEGKKEGKEGSETSGKDTQQDVVEEKKGFFDGLKERASNGWENVKEFVSKGRDNAKEFVKKYPIGSITALLGGIGIFSWLKNRKNSKEESEESKQKTEKKSFWNKWYGKVIKWSGIGTIIYYIAHGIHTGKRDLSNFFNWENSGPTSTAEENYDDYIEFSDDNPEKYKEYEQIGETINLMYDKIRDTEKNYFGADSQIVLGAIGDEAKEQKIAKSKEFKDVDTKGLVPYSLDNFFTNIGDMLSYKGVNGYIMSKNIEEYKLKIEIFGADWFNQVMVPFLSYFANSATFGIVSTDNAQQKMDKYFRGISENAEENKEILDLFFRQYTKVLTYMADRKNALATKCAREIIAANGYNNEPRPSDLEEQNAMIHEAINDSERVDQNLKSTKYGAFLSSNIMGAHKILKEEGLDNAEMTEELGDVVEGVDKKTEKILGGFDDNAFTRAEAKLNKGETLNEDEKNGINEVIDNIVEDLGDTEKGGWLYDTFDYGFELLGLSEDDRQLILKESGISKALNETVSSIQSFKSEVLANPTKENLLNLKKTVGEYTSMNKEIAVALYAIQEAKENKDLGGYISQVMGAVATGLGHFIGSVNDLIHLRGNLGDIAGDIINAFTGMVISGGIIEFGGKLTGRKWAVTIGHHIKKGLGLVTLAEMGLGKTRQSWAVKHRINDIAKTNSTKAENLMKKRILDGVLSKKHVCKILQENKDMKATFNVTGFQNNERVFKEVVYNIFGESNKEQADLFIKYYGKINGLVEYRKAKSGGWTDGKFYMNIDYDGFKVLKDFDIEFDRLGDTVQKSYFESMLKKVKNADDMKLLNEFIRNDTFKNMINNSNIDKLKRIKLSQLRMLEETGLLDDLVLNKKNIDQIMDELRQIEKMNISETRKMFKSEIDNAITRLREVTANHESIEYHIKQLKKLKYDTQLVDDEMEMFSKFMSKGFDAKIIPEIRKLFNITDTFSNGEKIGEKFKKLFSEGNFTEVKGLLNNPSYASKFESHGVTRVMREGIVKNFDDVFKALGHNHNAAKSALKVFFKTLSKIL